MRQDETGHHFPNWRYREKTTFSGSVARENPGKIREISYWNEITLLINGCGINSDALNKMAWDRLPRKSMSKWMDIPRCFQTGLCYPV